MVVVLAAGRIFDWHRYGAVLVGRVKEDWGEQILFSAMTRLYEQHCRAAFPTVVDGWEQTKDRAMWPDQGDYDAFMLLKNMAIGHGDSRST